MRTMVLALLLGACGAGVTLEQARTALDKARELQAVTCSQVDRADWYERCRAANEALLRADRAVKALEALDAGADAR